MPKVLTRDSQEAEVYWLPWSALQPSAALFFRAGILHHRGSARTFTAVRISRRSYIEMPPVTSRRHFRRIVYQRTMFWWLYYNQLWPLVNSLTEKSSFFRVFTGDMHPVVCQATGWSRITHQRCRSTNRVTCIMSNASSIMSIVRMICLLQSGSTAIPYPCEHITSADRTGILPAERWHGHPSAETDGGRAGKVYHIAVTRSSLNGLYFWHPGNVTGNAQV